MKEVNQRIKATVLLPTDAKQNEDLESENTVIVQKYIEQPLLVYKRKFDIRVFGLLTCVSGLLRGYFYEEGYLRTSSSEYSLGSLKNRLVHLTNDAI